jgi:plastocyanin
MYKGIGMNKVVIGGVVFVLVLGVLGIGVYMYSNSSSGGVPRTAEVMVSATPEVDSTSSPQADSTGSPQAGGQAMVANEISLAAFEFGFTPGELTVRAGEKVTLTLTNTSGKMTHDWVVEGTDIRTKILNKGETDTIEFTIDEPGTYTFYCSVGNHRAQGMEGTLIVK